MDSKELSCLLEKRRGEIIKQRHVLIFAIFLALALVSFHLLKILSTLSRRRWGADSGL
jgi:hypothetical protein